MHVLPQSGVLSLSGDEGLTQEAILEKKVQKAQQSMMRSVGIKAYLKTVPSLSIEGLSAALKSLPERLEKHCKIAQLDALKEKRAFYQSLSYSKHVPAILQLFGAQHIEDPSQRRKRYAKIYHNPQISPPLRFLAAQFYFRMARASQFLSTLARTYMQANALNEAQKQDLFQMVEQVASPRLRNELYGAIAESPQLFSYQEILAAASSISSSPMRDKTFLSLIRYKDVYTKPQLLIFALNITEYTQRDAALLNLLKTLPPCVKEDLSIVDKISQAAIRDDARMTLSQKFIPAPESLNMLKDVKDMHKRNKAYYDMLYRLIQKGDVSYLAFKAAQGIRGDRKLKLLAYKNLAFSAQHAARAKLAAARAIIYPYVFTLKAMIALSFLLGMMVVLYLQVC